MEERLFERWLKALENTPEERHAFGKYFDGEKVCAIGLLLEIAGEPVSSLEKVCRVMAMETGIATADMYDIVSYAMQLNDEKCALFKTIATHLKRLVS